MNNIIKDIKIHKVKVTAQGPFMNMLISNLYRHHINVSHIEYLDESAISFITKKENLKILKKDFKDYKFYINKEEGIYRLKPFILRNKVFFISLIFGLAIFICLKNIIVKVDVIHSDKEIRELVTNELEERGVKRLTFKKSFDSLQKIKQEILEKYPDKLEWIEIENIGMTYVVRIEQRIITEEKENNDYCHIVAKKDAILTKINSVSGMNMKESGDYVQKGDIIISGDILFNDEVKKSLCAEGSVYGEVWYNVDVSVPLNYKEKIETGKSRINFMYETSKEQHTILKSRLENKIVKNKKIFSLWGVTFYYQKEYEVIVKNKNYTEKEALNRAIELAKEKINVKLSDNERIIVQKVLKTSIKDSTMNVVVFTSVEENIGDIERYIPQSNNEETRDQE